jgi:hypothetical protein
MKYHSHRESSRDYWETSLPVVCSNNLEDCKKRTFKYLGYLTDFFVVDTETEETVYVYDKKKDGP